MSRDVRFRVHADRFAYTNGKYQRIVEPGDVQLLVGNSAANLTCSLPLRVTGSMRVLGNDRRLTTPVEFGAEIRGDVTD